MKSEKCFYFEEVAAEDRSFTYSYHIGGNYWVSDHPYTPDYFLFNQKRLASFKDGKFYLHNAPDKVCTYYSGSPSESSLDVVFPIGTEAVLHNVSWEAKAQDVTGKVQHEETFDYILIYNNDQCTNLIPLKKYKGLRDVLGMWRFNDFADVVINRDAPFIVQGKLVTSNLKTGGAWFKKSLLIDKFFVVRLVHTNISQNNLYIYAADVVVSKSVR